MYDRRRRMYKVHVPASEDETAQVRSFLTRLDPETTIDNPRYGKTNVDEVDRLGSQISELRNVVLQQKTQAHTHASPISGIVGTGTAADLDTSLSPQFFDKPNAQETSISRPGSVIKHLGRLVSVLPGQAFFAGPTTGVHFVRSVEQRWKYLSDSNEAFPDLFYKMYLLVQPTMLCPFADTFCEPPRTSVPSVGEDLYLPKKYYLSRVRK